MAKKRQPTSAASKDDEPLTAISKKDKPLPSASKKEPPPPSKKPKEEKVEQKDDEDSTSEEASSSEGEEDDESEDDESEEEQLPSSQPASKTSQTEKSESKKDEDEEETDSDSDQEPPPKLNSIDQTLKSKPQPKSPKKGSAGSKRSADIDTKHADEAKQSKKKKTTAAADDKAEKEEEKEEDYKKPGDDGKKLFQRVFNEDDELAILKGLVDFTAETGNDPVCSMDFYNYVKKSIHFPVTLDQLKDKVRRLKLKFENKMKSFKNGKTPTFSKPIEETMFEFGKKIWGGNTVEENGKPGEKPSKKGAAKKSPTMIDLTLLGSKETRKENPSSSLILSELDRFQKSVSGVFGLGMDFLKSGVELLEESKRVEFEKRWNQLLVAELEVRVMQAELAEEQGGLILDKLRSSLSD